MHDFPIQVQVSSAPIFFKLGFDFLYFLRDRRRKMDISQRSAAQGASSLAPTQTSLDLWAARNRQECRWAQRAHRSWSKVWWRLYRYSIWTYIVVWRANRSTQRLRLWRRRWAKRAWTRVSWGDRVSVHGGKAQTTSSSGGATAVKFRATHSWRKARDATER